MCDHNLAERVCAVSQLLQYWGLLPQMLVCVAQVNIVTDHGNTQLIMEPAERGWGARAAREKTNEKQLEKHSKMMQIWKRCVLLSEFSTNILPIS